MLRPPQLLSLILLALLLAGCGSIAKPQAQLVLVKDLVDATPTPTPTPAVTETRAVLPPAGPFELVIDDVLLASTSNAAMFAAPEPAADEAVVRQAIEAARLKAQTYLNAMFVDPATRFSVGAVATIVDPGLLDPAAMAGLGVLQDPPQIIGTKTGQAHAIADVHVDVSQIGAVTLSFTATSRLVLPGAEGPITQEGYISVVDRGAGPEVVLLTATTTFGGMLPEVLG